MRKYFLIDKMAMLVGKTHQPLKYIDKLYAITYLSRKRIYKERYPESLYFPITARPEELKGQVASLANSRCQGIIFY